MKLIHCADIHLDSPMQTHMTARQAATRSAEVLRSFVRMTQYARENGVRAVIIAGDLFDGDRVRERTVDAVLDAMQKTPEVDYLYLPGNHDEAAGAFCDRELPENLSCSETAGELTAMRTRPFRVWYSVRTEKKFTRDCRMWMAV